MKIFVISLMCALAGGVAGSLLAWNAPQLYSGAVVRTVIPPQIKGYAYSSSQYINSVPTTAYSVGFQPQFAYQIPSLSGLAPVHSTYYPIASHSIYPTSVFLTTVPGVASVNPAAPAIPIAPATPEAPTQSNPSFSDTTVVDSADQTQAQGPSSTSTPAQSGQPYPPASTFPNFPTIPQISQLQDLSQGSQASFPQTPVADADYSQGPGAAPPSFLGGNGGDKGINDEDTVSVESA